MSTPFINPVGATLGDTVDINGYQVIREAIGTPDRVKPAQDFAHSLNKASVLVMLADALVLIGSGAFILWYYVGLSLGSYAMYSVALIAPSLVMIGAFYENGVYSYSALCNPWGQVTNILKIMALTFLAFLAIAFAFKVSEHLSRVWVFSWFLLSTTLVFMERGVCRILFTRWARAGLFSRKIVVVGCGAQTEKFIEQLEAGKEPWVKIAGLFDDRRERTASSFMGYPVLGNMEDLLDFARENRVDDIVVNLPWTADSRIIDIVRKLEELPVHIRLGSDMAGFVSSRASFSSLAGIPVLDVVQKPLDGWGHFWKAAEDKILGLLFLLILSPVMLLIALAIKMESSGPALFLQRRYGFNNKPFWVFKFRSMYHNKQSTDSGVPQATRNDPRVTRIGAFLRRTSLDELPQLLNVINGTMSLVGPRPHAVEHNEEYAKMIDGYFSRHRVKPGITGWAQVCGLRGETDTLDKMIARVEHDIHYIENWSPILDLRIIFMTAIVVALQKNAY